MFRLSTRTLPSGRHRAYNSLLGAISALPLPVAYPLASLLGRLVCAMDDRRREACVATIAMRLGIDRPDAERLARRTFELMVCDSVEGRLIPRLDKTSIGRLLRFDGLDYLDSALARGHGAVVYSGHCWSSNLCLVGLGLLEYPVVLVRGHRERANRDPSRRPLFANISKTIEGNLGGRILYSGGRDGGVALGPMCVSALRKNQIVALNPDLLPGTARLGDQTVNFLNDAEGFRQGGAQLARATGAPLLSVWIHRPDRLLPARCVIGSPIEVNGDVPAAVAAQVERLEAEVRSDPASWKYWLIRSGWELSMLRAMSQRP